MKNKKSLNLILLLFALIIGSAFYKQFDFETLEFQKPALAIVYAITFSACVLGIVRGFTKQD